MGTQKSSCRRRTNAITGKFGHKWLGVFLIVRGVEWNLASSSDLIRAIKVNLAP
jgi:hypothetical protein